MKTYHKIKKILADAGIEDGECMAVALLLMEGVCGMSSVDVLMGREPDDDGSVMAAANRVAAGEPVQYVLGKAEWCGLEFMVRSGVLIPRPETEELVREVVERVSCGNVKVLDVCTGSGCIAIALAKRLEGAQVVGVDVSDEALAVAKENAKRLGANVCFEKKDILSEDIVGEWDVIVSNPPYVCMSESEEMERNVLEHEPHQALFVPDDAPLLFYDRIADIACGHLRQGGLLALEINRRFGKEVVGMLESKGFANVVLKQDEFGNDRIVTAIKR